MNVSSFMESIVQVAYGASAGLSPTNNIWEALVSALTNKVAMPALIGGAAFLLIALAPGFALAAGGTCVINRATFRTVDTDVSTNSTTFTLIPQTVLNVTVGGTAPTCVIVAFSSQAGTGYGFNMEVRPVLSGIGTGEPPAVAYAGDSAYWNTHSMHFVFPDVPPGSYKVRMQFRKIEAETTPVHIGRRTLLVQHR